MVYSAPSMSIRLWGENEMVCSSEIQPQTLRYAGYKTRFKDEGQKAEDVLYFKTEE